MKEKIIPYGPFVAERRPLDLRAVCGEGAVERESARYCLQTQRDRAELSFEIDRALLNGANALLLSVKIEGFRRFSLTLFGKEGQDAWEGTADPEREQRFVFDLNEFSVSPERATLSFFGEEQTNKRVVLSECSFGKLFDLTFLRGNAAECLRTENADARVENGALSLRFSAQGRAEFPSLAGARGTPMNFRFGVKDSVVLIARSSHKARFRLEYRTESKSSAASFRVGVSEERVVVPLSGKAGERILGMSLCCLDECELTVRKLSFEQERDILDDEEAARWRKSHVARMSESPYPFSTGHAVADVRAFGAVGNGFDDDTAAAETAIEFIAKRGGGRVCFPAGIYSVTHLVLRSNIELFLSPGATILQSERAQDYPYAVRYGHDDREKGCMWPHSFLVTNRPLLYANGAKNIRITGGGKIRMSDAGAEITKCGYPDWPVHCAGIIHVLPIAFCSCENVEVSGIDVVRVSSYHMMFTACKNVVVRGVCMYDARCLSSDGIGVRNSQNVLIADCLIVGNDDGVTLSSNSSDPRSGGWWSNDPDADNRTRNVEIAHCYINSGHTGNAAGGKAIALIPWASDAKNPEMHEIDGIYVHDCVLKGGWSVGTWCDNPFHGKVPFDNSETDDYSAVKNVTVLNNDYRAKVDIEALKMTFVRSDAGLFSAPCVLNGDFAAGLCNWEHQGAAVRDGRCFIERGEIVQSLHPERATRFTAVVKGEGEFFVGKETVPFCCDREMRLVVERKEAGEVSVGVLSDSFAEVLKVESCNI